MREGRRAKTGTRTPKAMRERERKNNKVSLVLLFLAIVDHLELHAELLWWLFLL